MIKKDYLIFLSISGILFFTFFSNNILSLCNENQININTASLNELEKIIEIGPVLAQRIIDSRPFSSIDDLIRVKGIGNKTLEKIKNQSLACVEDSLEETINEKITIEENTSKELTTKELSTEKTSEQKNILSKGNETSYNSENKSLNSSYNETIFLKEIVLSTKDNSNKTLNSKGIKTLEINDFLERISLYGILILGVVLTTLIILKQRKLKNELQ